jgi:hypothetical protein
VVLDKLPLTLVSAETPAAAGNRTVITLAPPAPRGRAVRQAEHAMWDAEVVAAIGKAATIIPDHGEG